MTRSALLCGLVCLLSTGNAFVPLVVTPQHPTALTAAFVTETPSSTSSAKGPNRLLSLFRRRRQQQQPQERLTTHDALQLDQATATTPVDPTTTLSSTLVSHPEWELPRHIEADVAKAELLLDTEMIVGRAAMAAALLALATELTTGLSLPTQLLLVSGNL